MNDVVDRILNAYQLKRPLDPQRVADSKKKISAYLESLASAGQRDAKKLTIYGLSYHSRTARGAGSSVHRLLAALTRGLRRAVAKPSSPATNRIIVGPGLSFYGNLSREEFTGWAAPAAVE